MNLFSENGACFSECRKYRFALWRIWDETKPLVMFIGLNPSTANELSDDPTIRRVKRFAFDWGFGGVYMMNCFPFISTDPNDLKDFGNTAENDFWLKEVEKKVTQIVFSWGGFKIVRETGREREMEKMFPNAKALILNKDRTPRHPLYVKSSVELVDF